MRDEGFKVIALHFFTGFNGSVSRMIKKGPRWKWIPEQHVIDSALNLGIYLRPMDVRGEFFNIVCSPRYGYGSSANPCIDCRIFLLKKAREVMEAEGAVLVFTGEVLGQRPMSQLKNQLRLEEKRSGLDGKLLRPLSAKLLKPTIAEAEGIVNREHLYDIQGRSRSRQQELARAFGIEVYPSPAGGCVLTDRFFGIKFKDLISQSNGNEITPDDLFSLLTGRHLRLDSGMKVIVGRNESENNFLMKLLTPRAWCFEARDYEGASVFALDEPEEGDFLTIASITARYGKGANEDSVAVSAKKGDNERIFSAKPMKPEDTERLLISRI